ncbi:tetratricopeptide repeat protein [Desulforegula conservatrix]|uniref:tetratricopeptide repeat protein n=1 Tax=Desulforegula conservatrix TaxID=153026 RepID=UPI0004291625|nr:tetratricopeptide repeat protein [Desulforegula conservatrix]
MKTMKSLTLFVIITIFFFLVSGSVHAAVDKTRDAIFLDSVKAYEKGDYKASAKGFEKIATEYGVSSPSLYYNIGNSYLKLENYGLAALWYKRAERLSPSDPDLKYNSGYLENRLKDDFEIKRTIFYDIFFMQRFISEPYILKIGLILNLVFWLSCAMLYFKKNQYIKPVIALTGAASFVFLSNSFYCLYERAAAMDAVVIPPEISVKSGTSENAPDLFKLHAGTIVLIEEIQDGYARISNGDDKRGWIKKGDAIAISGSLTN